MRFILSKINRRQKFANHDKRTQLSSRVRARLRGTRCRSFCSARLVVVVVRFSCERRCPCTEVFYRLTVVLSTPLVQARYYISLSRVPLVKLANKASASQRRLPTINYPRVLQRISLCETHRGLETPVAMQYDDRVCSLLQLSEIERRTECSLLKASWIPCLRLICWRYCDGEG